VDIPAAVAEAIPREVITKKARDIGDIVFTERVDVNEVKNRGGRGVLCGTPFLFGVDYGLA